VECRSQFHRLKRNGGVIAKPALNDTELVRKLWLLLVMSRIHLLIAVVVTMSSASVAVGQARTPRLPVTPKLAPVPKLPPNPEPAPTPGLEVRSRNTRDRDQDRKAEPTSHRRRRGGGRTVFYDPYYDVVVPAAPLPSPATGTSPSGGASGSTNPYTVPTYQVPTYAIPKYP
jgi:hypothetical protein